MPLNFHIIQHVEFEGPANIGKWVKENGHKLSYSRLYDGDSYPSQAEFDILIVMGGPMSVNNSDTTPWMQNEISFIQQTIEFNKPVLGICLGAQFIAKSLNAKAYTGPNKEIGWFPITFNKQELLNGLVQKIPENITTFHWHGDTFDIPEGAVHLASSAGTPNQGFIYNEKVVALQFHLEMSSESILSMLKHCSDDITNGEFIQTPTDIQQGLINEINNYALLSTILSYLSRSIN